jgi:chromosome segregation ATPase
MDRRVPGPFQEQRAKAVSESEEQAGIRARGEEALGDLAQALLDNPLLSGALGRALGAGERAASAQRSAMHALNLPAGADVERLERRLRSLSDRLEQVEDELDQLGAEMETLRSASREKRPSSSPRPASS